MSLYFMQKNAPHGPIKIGISENVASRLTSLQGATDEPIRIITTAPGGRKAEKYLHARVAAHRISGEWFAPHQEVLDLIEEVTRRGDRFLPPDDDAVVARIKDEREKSATIRMVCREYINAIGLPFGFDETRKDQITKVAKITGLPYRTIKSIRYGEGGAITAYVLLTLQKHFNRRMDKYVDELRAKQAAQTLHEKLEE